MLQNVCVSLCNASTYEEQSAYLNRVADEVASVGSLQEALFTGGHEGGWDGIANHLIHKLHALVALFQGLHVPNHPPILALPTCSLTSCCDGM